MAKQTNRKRQQSKTLQLDGDEAFRVLTSPRCQEIVQAFEPEQRQSVRQIAKRLGYRAESLYYHIRKLVKIGVLLEVDKQRSGPRYESIYALAAPRIELNPDASSTSSQAAAAKLTASLLRMAAREYQAAFESGRLKAVCSTPHAWRMRARLTEADLQAVQSLLGRIEKICQKSQGQREGTPFSVTSIVIPLPADSAW